MVSYPASTTNFACLKNINPKSFLSFPYAVSLSIYGEYFQPLLIPVSFCLHCSDSLNINT